MTSPNGQSNELPVLPTASELLKLGNRPAPIVTHPPWNAARDSVISLVTAAPGLIAVLGPPGSGKTTLLRELCSTLSERGYAARLLEFADGPAEADPAEVVLVDEADRMSSTRLEALCRRDDATIILAALPAFAQHLQNHYPGVAIVSLTTLSPNEAFAFLAERLAQHGLPVSCLTEAAWAQLIKHGNGVPRLLLALLNLTLLIAAEDHAEHATEVHVERAAEVRSGVGEGTDAQSSLTIPDFVDPDAVEPIPDPPESASIAADAGKTKRRPWRGTAAAACLIAAVALLIWWKSDEIASSGPGASTVSGEVKRAAIADANTDKSGELPEPDGTAKPLAHAWTTAQSADVATVAVTPAALQPSAPAAISDNRAAPQGLVAPNQPAMAPSGMVEPQRETVATASSNAAPEDAKVSDPPAMAVTGTTHDLPPNALIRVVLTYPRGDTAAAKRGEELARALRTDRLRVGDPIPVATRIANKAISYYFEQDGDAATDLSRRLRGEYGEAKLIRLPRAASQPRPGTIEIALGSD